MQGKRSSSAERRPPGAAQRLLGRAALRPGTPIPSDAPLAPDPSGGDPERALALAYSGACVEVHARGCPLIRAPENYGTSRRAGPRWTVSSTLFRSGGKSSRLSKKDRGVVPGRAEIVARERVLSLLPAVRQVGKTVSVLPRRQLTPSPPVPPRPNRCGGKADASFGSSSRKVGWPAVGNSSPPLVLPACPGAVEFTERLLAKIPTARWNTRHPSSLSSFPRFS